MTQLKPNHHQIPIKLRSNERQIILFIVDNIVAGLALLIGLYFWARADAWIDFSWEFILTRPLWFYLLPGIWLLLMSGLYQERRASIWDETIRGIFFAALIGLILYMAFYFFYPPKALPRRGVASFIVAVTLLTVAWRYIYIRVFTAPHFLRRVLLVGGGESGQIILRIINKMVPQPFIMEGIIDDDPGKMGKSIEGFSVLGGNDQLIETIGKREITDLIVAISGNMKGSMFQALLDAQEKGVEIIRMPVAYEELLDRVPIRYLEADWILRSFVDQMRSNTYYGLVKRLFDILGGLVGIFLLIFTFPIVSVAILLDTGFPVFYFQTRMGRGGMHYKMIKYRTMGQNAEPDGQPKWAEENDKRATLVGRYLRKTHIDELPQFINVLRGEMSLVGPRAERPELVEFFQQEVPFYRARLLVKPGMTGWAQVNQDYAATVDETIEKLEYDLYYIKHRNLVMDLRVLLRTPTKVFGFRGR